MIKKIKDLKAQRDKTAQKIKDLFEKKTGMLADALEIEDSGRDSGKARKALDKARQDIELSENRLKQLDNEIRQALNLFLDNEIANYPGEVEQLKEKQKEALYSGGEGLAQACLALESLGPDGARVANELVTVLKRHTDICKELISGRAAVINLIRENGGNEFLAQKTRFDRIRNVLTNPTNRPHVIEKMFSAIMKNDIGYLVGR